MTEPTAIALTVETGPCRGVSAVIRTTQAFLGRDADAQLSLQDDTTVSRRHASLSWEDGRWVLRDLASKNGTFSLVGTSPEPIFEPRRVTPGARFVLGSAIIAVSTHQSLPIEATQLRIALTAGTLELELEQEAAIAVRASCPYPGALVEALHRDLVALNATAEFGGLAIEQKFIALGQQLAEAILPESIREHLLAAENRPLSLLLDPGLIGIAWESLCLAGRPLCIERPVARRIRLENVVTHTQKRGQRFLIVSNPTGDLPESQRHGEALLDSLTGEYALPDVSFIAGRRATVHNVIAALSSCDVVVYFGHATHISDHGGGWLMSDGLLGTAQIAALTHAPAFVVAAACESARESLGIQDQILLPGGTGIATSFMMAGTQQYVGSLWRMPVVSGTTFATVLLSGVLSGIPLGDAVLRARRHLKEVLGAPVQVYAGYTHYGALGWTLGNGFV